MRDFSRDLLVDYVDVDNAATLKICNSLIREYRRSLNVFPSNQNLLAIFFFDILKLLTGTYLRHREISEGLAPKDRASNEPLLGWPYVGYDDIRHGCDPADKVHAGPKLIKQKITSKAVQRLLNLKKSINRASKLTLNVTTPRLDSAEKLIWLESPYLEASLIDTDLRGFSVEQIGDQIVLLKNTIREVIEATDHPLSPALLGTLMAQRVSSMCASKSDDFEFSADTLVLSSGVDLSNRMLAAQASRQGVSVVNVMHGEAFGTLDEPAFSEFGEFMFANAFLGYSGGSLNFQSTYCFGKPDDIPYIESDAARVKSIFSPTFSGVSFKKDQQLKFFYFPTTLSGSSYRYGPYRDTADELYISWQRALFQLLGGMVTLKVHPKEKYRAGSMFPDIPQSDGSFNAVLDFVDVFVFDYMGTAFNQACASDKPIVYFDLGIRNISPQALIDIKERVAYFDIRDGLPTFDEIREQLGFLEKDNTYSRKYSIAGTDESRAASLITGLEGLKN